MHEARNQSDNIYGLVDYINEELRALFSLADDIELLTAEYENSVLDFDFHLESIYEYSLPLSLTVEDLGLDQWGLEGLEDLTAIEADGTINLLASSELSLGLTCLMLQLLCFMSMKQQVLTFY